MFFYYNKLIIILILIIKINYNYSIKSPPSIWNKINIKILNNNYNYDTKYFTQIIDHFNFYNSQCYETQCPLYKKITFQQRYLINTESWQPNQPIFLYTGNEGDIELFADNSGFIWEQAKKFNAMVLFIEMRYYGKSLPFDEFTFNQTAWNLQYLTTEQTLADYAIILNYIKTQLYNSQNSAVIAFGGSLGGMLCTWMRIKYPHLVNGCIASSAPILQFSNVTSPKVFSNIVTNTFRQSNKYCPDLIYRSWDIMKTIDLNILQNIFKLCQKPNSTNDVEEIIFPWLADAYVYMTMGDYPYPANFLGSMPGYPVKYSCSRIVKDPNSMTEIEILQHIKTIIDVYHNFTGKIEQCYDIEFNNDNNGLDLYAWGYQTCTEMTLPMGYYGMPNDMFYISKWDLQSFREECSKAFSSKTRLDPNWAILNYGGPNIEKSLSTTSNIVFTNGNLDPWYGGGVLKKSINPSIIVLMINNGAHHLDLRASNPLDPPSVIEARKIEIDNIKKWILQHETNTNNNENNNENNVSSFKSTLIILIVAHSIGFFIIGILVTYFVMRKYYTRSNRYEELELPTSQQNNITLR